MSAVNTAPFGLRVNSTGRKISDLDRAEALRLVRKHKLVLFRGLSAFDREALLQFAAENPNEDLVHWSFGPVMEMTPKKDTENYLFSQEAVPFHWDGAFHEVPRVLVFHCVDAPAARKGGETIFCDTEALWNDAGPDLQKKWKKISLHYSTERKVHYGGNISLSMVQSHPDKGTTILRYAEPVDSELNPVRLRVDGASSPGVFCESMRRLLYSPHYCMEHEWEENDLLLVDNYSLLHGRKAFSSPRHLRRVQIR